MCGHGEQNGHRLATWSWLTMVAVSVEHTCDLEGTHGGLITTPGHPTKTHI